MYAGVGRVLADSELDAACSGIYRTFRTAFVVSRQYALTAAHCVAEEAALSTEGSQLWLQFIGTADRPQNLEYRMFIPFQIYRVSNRFDIAFLKRDADRDAFTHMRRSPNSRNSVSYKQARRSLARRRLLMWPALLGRYRGDVVIEGFPAPGEGAGDDSTQVDGRTLPGRVVTATASLGSVRGIDVQSPSLSAVAPENPTGFSGGPVLKAGSRKVIGVVSSHQRGRLRSSAKGGSLYVVRIDDALRQFSGMLPTVLFRRLLLPASIVGIAVVAAIAGALLGVGQPPALPVPSPSAIGPQTQLPGCYKGPAVVAGTKLSEGIYVTSSHGPGNAIQLTHTGDYMEQPFVAAAPLLDSVEVVAAYNDQTSDNLDMRISSADGKVVWQSTATVDVNNTNQMVPADRQPSRLPLTVGAVYVLRVTNISTDRVALFSHSLAAEDQVQYGEPACVKDQSSPYPHPAPSGQYLAARLLGSLK